MKVDSSHYTEDEVQTNKEQTNKEQADKVDELNSIKEDEMDSTINVDGSYSNDNKDNIAS